MPRIRRWFPVSHEINRDREVQTLRDLFGDSMVLVWLEMLSEADRKDGKVVGTVAEIATDLSWIVSRTRPQRGVERIQNALTYMVEKGWIENRNSYFLVCNYGKFHRHREQIESREGTVEAPHQTRPNQTRPKDLKDVSSDPTSRPSDLDPVLRGWLENSQHLKSLANGKHGAFWQALVTAYDAYPFLYFQEEIKKADSWIAANPTRKPTDRGLPRFFRSWLEKSVEKGRKRP